MMATARQIVFVALLGIHFASCQKSCGKAAEDMAQNQAKAPPVEVHGKDAKKADAMLDYDGLTDAQIASVEKMLNEEICPCGCPTTFAKCLAMKEGCKPAKLLAEWTVKQLKEGAPEHYLYKAISEEIGAGYLAEPKTIDTKNAYSKGNPNAAYVIVEFADFECPACRLAYSEVKAFFNDHKEDLRIYFMHFPLSIHPNAERAAIAAEAAGKQGKFWEMHDLLFASNDLSDAGIKKLAASLFNKTELAKFEKDLKDPGIMQKIKDQKDYGLNTVKLIGTPTFMFNGRPYNLSSAKDGYELRLEMERARKDINCQLAP